MWAALQPAPSRCRARLDHPPRWAASTPSCGNDARDLRDSASKQIKGPQAKHANRVGRISVNVTGHFGPCDRPSRFIVTERFGIVTAGFGDRDRGVGDGAA
jgi:hypothetical protein